MMVLTVESTHLCGRGLGRHRVLGTRQRRECVRQQPPRSWLELAGQVVHSLRATLHLVLVLVALTPPVAAAALALGLIVQLRLA